MGLKKLDPADFLGLEQRGPNYRLWLKILVN
jgi:hypothetical protein